jgi:hypothetical protein
LRDVTRPSDALGQIASGLTNQAAITATGGPPMRRSTLLLLVAGTLFCIAPRPAAAVPLLPDFSSDAFDPAQPIDNPYFPMTDGRTYVYRAFEDGEPIEERFELTNTGPGPIIAGVQSFIQRDREFEDGLLVEETSDYFAQDTLGNVWYLGEDTTKFEYDDEGNLVGTSSEGTWRAGVNGAEPGFIMPADLDDFDIGFNYFQEHAPVDDALDQGTISAFGEFGTFQDVLQVLETTELEPDSREFKYYALGVGLIRVEEDLDENFENPELVFELTDIRSVPEPGTAGLLLLGIVVIAGARARRRRAPQA